MDSVYYLVHTTSTYNSDWKELITSKVHDFEFPGVYFSIITKHNIRQLALYPQYEAEKTKMLIFSKKLLEQKNYHINLADYNGHVTEDNTYFTWNVEEAIDKINAAPAYAYYGHEVVFHDPIPMDYLCVVIDSVASIPLNHLLPDFSIENKTPSDMTKRPFLCYPFERNFGGKDPRKESSRHFFEKMAVTCGVDKELSTDEIIKQIKDKLEYLYTHREKQNIKALQTMTRKSASVKGTTAKRTATRSKSYK
jgi:hypothetical protein